MLRREFLATGAAAVVLPLSKLTAFAPERRLLYIAVPGIRNYVEYGGVGVLVYDIGSGYTVRQAHSHVGRSRGPAAGERQGRGRQRQDGQGSTSARSSGLGCIDLLTEKMVWSKELEGGCDRMAISPDGQILYVPSLEGPHWNVVDAMSGDVITKVVTDSGAHNTVYSRRRRPRLPRGPALAVAVGRRHEDPQGRQDRRPLLGADPPVHGERRPDAAATSTSTGCSVSRSAISRPARSCTASRSRATSRGR